MTDIVETIAKAMAEANGELENWAAWLMDARAALAAIEAAGMAVVPVNPTDAQYGAFHRLTDDAGVALVGAGYRAMVEAGRLRT